MENKRVKLQEKEDRISDLPDSIIHYILSFLPSTKQAIQTSVLSKRWQTQWTRVPVLIFINSSAMSYENFLKFIDNTLVLHDCSKIKKFHLDYGFDRNEKDPQFASKIRFATRKHVEELNFKSNALDRYMLPTFLFNNASLVKLRTQNCSFMPNGKVNWGCLTVLNIVCCKLTDQAIGHILSGSPLLKSLELTNSLSEKIVIASKSLKILVLRQLCGIYVTSISVLEISCPNLEELSMDNVVTDDPQLFAQVIENVVSGSLLLQSFELNSCRGIEQLVIASKSLKRLVLHEIRNDFDIEISCPHLEELKLSGFFNVKTAKLLDLPSSLCAAIDFYHDRELKLCKRMIEDILQQLQHVKELKIGRWCIEVLSVMKIRDRFSPVLNIKCLTLSSPQLKKHHSGIACVLRISPVLEKLVINVSSFRREANYNVGNNYWISNTTVFDCLVSHLKSIKIIGFPARDGRLEHMLNLVQFLLNNARVLEKMVVVLKNCVTTSYPLELCKKLSSLPRYSQNAIIEVLSK